MNEYEIPGFTDAGDRGARGICRNLDIQALAARYERDFQRGPTIPPSAIGAPRIVERGIRPCDIIGAHRPVCDDIAGDAVLRQLSGLVKANIRREDIFARVGGEEFAVIVPETTADEARAVTEKIRALVEASEMVFDTIVIPVTVSLGVASLAPEDDAEALYAKSDALLYRAKQSGRNRVVT